MSKRNKRGTRKNRRHSYSYVFGYGSLVNTQSRLNTIKSALKAYPVVIDEQFGYERDYYYRDRIGRGAERVLGIKKNPRKDTLINGALFKVPNDRLKDMDLRENNYKKIRIPWEYVLLYGKSNPQTSVPIYAYQPLPEISEGHRGKISDEYLDITIQGFLEYGIPFTRLFFDTTKHLPEGYRSLEEYKESMRN